MATTASLPPYMLPGVSVHQPTHLEGDPALATEILPGPPSLVSAQQSAQKRDPRKPSMAYSYLPLSDPGSTYSGVMHGTLIGHEEPCSKRSRGDKGATGRAQRASARNQTASTLAPDPTSSTEPASGSGIQPIVLEAEPSGSATGDEEAPLSRSNSSHNLQEPLPQSSASKGRKRDKGKGKEVETPLAKEDLNAVPPLTPDPSNLLKNNDHCSSCRSNGALVYCDGCPRAFHLWCLDPPMENIDEGDSRWFCPGCVIRKHPPRKPPPSLLSPLIYQVQTSIPVEFQLPDEIRNFFRDVTTGPKGTYVDAAEVKPPRLNRHGLLEDRDPHRLRDKNGAAVLCFRCGMSALPTGLASTVSTAKRPRRAASTPDEWKSILSCDYCDLHWHLDCLDPPLPTMPPFNKRWMCYNHSERVLPSKRRIPKNNATPIEISKPRQYNNGSIEIVQSEAPTTVVKPRVQVEEVLINGRRYRVPEKILILDFWSKLNRHEPRENRDLDVVSALSSPLTSLSSLEDPDDYMEDHSLQDNLGDLQAAQLLFNFSSSSTKHPPTIAKSASIERPIHLENGVANGAVASSSANISKKTPPSAKISNSIASQPTATIAPVPASIRPSRSAKNVASLRISNAITDLQGSESTPQSADGTVAEAHKKRQRAARKQTGQKVQSQGTRELRSQSRNTRQDSISSVVPEIKTVPVIRIVDESHHAGSSTSTSTSTIGGMTKFRTVFVKYEEDETPLSFAVPAVDQKSLNSTALPQATPRRRQSRRSIKAPEETAKVDEKDVKERRGRKRKTREDELPETSKKAPSGKRSRKDKIEAGDDSGAKDKKDAATPASITVVHTPISSPRIVPPARIPATPTKLKIRLPRLGSTTKPAVSTVVNGNADTPTRL